MKNFLLLPLAICCCAACTQTPEPDDEPFVITFDSTEINVSAEGGYARAPYSFTGSRDNISSIGVDCPSSWITEKIYDVPGEIIVSVEANPDTTDRVAVLNVGWYGGSETVYVMQDGRDPSSPDIPDDGEDAIFEITVNQIKESSVIYSVYPSDTQMTYLNLLMDKASYDMFEDEDTRFANDMAYFNQVAQTNGMSLEELLRQNLKTGNTIGVSVTSLTPDTEYCIYVYGVTSEAERLTGYVPEFFVTESVPFVDIDFDLNPTVNGNHVVIEAIPSDDTVPYVMDAYSGRGIDGEWLKESYQTYINDVINIYTMLGQSAADAVKSIAHVGPDAIEADLNPNSDYTAFAVSISLSGYLNSEVSTKDFSTGSAQPSDNVITIEITKLEPDYAEYAIYTTNNDQYALAALDSRQVEGRADDQIIAALINDNLITLVNGDVTGSLSPLAPGTEYVMFAFGYSGGTVTTGLVKEYFTTPSGGTSSVGAGRLNLKLDRETPVPVLTDYKINKK